MKRVAEEELRPGRRGENVGDEAHSGLSLVPCGQPHGREGEAETEGNLPREDGRGFKAQTTASWGLFEGVVLPPHVASHITAFLDIRDLAALEQTCRGAHAYWELDSAWALILRSQFPALKKRYEVRNNVQHRELVRFASELDHRWTNRGPRDHVSCNFFDRGCRSGISALRLSDSERDRAFCRPSIVVAATASRSVHAIGLKLDKRADQTCPRAVLQGHERTLCLSAFGSFGDAVILAGTAGGKVQVLSHQLDAGDHADSGCSELASPKRSSTSLMQAEKPQLGDTEENGILKIVGEVTVTQSSTRHVLGLWDRSQFLTCSSHEPPATHDLERLQVISRAPERAAVHDVAMEDNVIYFATGQGIKIWDLRDPGAYRQSEYTNDISTCVAVEHDGFGIAFSVKTSQDPDEIVVMADRRYPSAAIHKRPIAQSVVALGLDSSRLFISSAHVPTYAIFTPDLQRSAGILLPRPSFQSGGGGRSTLHPGVVDMTSSLVIGANMDGDVLYGWNFDPATPAGFHFEDYFEPRSMPVMPRMPQAYPQDKIVAEVPTIGWPSALGGLGLSERNQDGVLLL